MSLTWADWAVVCIPIALAIMGAIVSVRPPDRQFHWHWFVGFLVLGAVCAGATLWQLNTTRKSEAIRRTDDLKARNTLNAQIEELRIQLPKIGTNLQKLRANVTPRPKLVQPELSLILVWPKSVDVVIVNRSSTIAYKPYYLVALWNLDAKGDDLMQPLPMSSSHLAEYIKPHEQWGPNQMMALPEVRARAHTGDRLFGWADLNCTECRRKNYWVYVQDGIGGWYSETKPHILINMGWFTKALPEIAANPEAYLARLAPAATRKPIEQ